MYVCAIKPAFLTVLNPLQRNPHRFVGRFKDELTDVADFIVPNGRVWKVGLSKEGNSVWFDDGWQIFAEHHSICHGYFLVFGYRGFCCFDVIVFDASASEIEFPLATDAPSYDKLDNVAEMRDDKPYVRVKSQHSCAVSVVSIRKCFTRFQDDPKIAISQHCEAESSDKFEDEDVKIITCGNLERIVTTPYVPGGFSRYLTHAPRTLKLRVSEGKEWEVCLTKRPDRWDLGKGWFIFLKDNNLKGGDVCVFEMQKNKSVLKVSIFRALEDSSHENGI